MNNEIATGELNKEAVTEKISATAADGKNYLAKWNRKRRKNISCSIPPKRLTLISTKRFVDCSMINKRNVV